MPPKLIGPYRVLETLGSGGAGTVYRARDRRTGDDVALKLLTAAPALDPKAARRLAREFETLSDLSHPNVVRVFDTGVHHGYPYLAMELVEGLTLRHYLSLKADEVAKSIVSGHVRADPLSNHSHTQEGELDASPTPFGLSAYSAEMPSEEVSSYGSGPGSVRAFADAMDEPDTALTHDSISGAELESFTVEAPLLRPGEFDEHELNRPERVGRLKDSMLQLCQALAHIHAHGVVHRDLKPSNVMVDEDGIVKLMDFGLAKFLADDASVTATGRLVGTYRYMAPELILGEPLDARSDLYSLGVILYELLAGRPPFDARTPHELWQKVLETEAPPISSINGRADLQLVRVAQRLMRKEPDDRFQTAEEVYEALTE